MSSPRALPSYLKGLLPLLVLFPLALLPAACKPSVDGTPDAPSTTQAAEVAGIDGDRLLRDISVLAHDSMEGRRTGTPGAERSRTFLLQEFPARGLQPLGGGWTSAFQFEGRGDAGTMEGLNVLGWIEGSEHPDRYIVVTAHYDHLGLRDDETYNGADDNASGTAALLALAGWFSENRPSHSLLFIALDAEEMGLQGARAFVADAPIPLESVAVNVNLDMVSRSEAGELYAAGTYHYPFLLSVVEAVAGRSEITLLTGHDSPDLPAGDDWTMSSDHGPFHEAGVPFLYFGVEDHAGYHQPSDVFEDITPEFYIRAVDTIRDVILTLDREGIPPR